MPALSPEQKQAVTRAGDAPVRITDPESDASFVLIRSEVYERMLAISEGDPDPRDGYPAVDRVMAEDDALDPYLHLYQDGP